MLVNVNQLSVGIKKRIKRLAGNGNPQRVKQLAKGMTVNSPDFIFNALAINPGVSLDIENYCTLRLFFDLSILAGLSRRNLPEAGIRLLFHI